MTSMASDSLIVTHPLEGTFVTLSRLTYEDMPSLWRNLDLQNSARLWNFLVLHVPNSAEQLWEQMKPIPGVETLAVRGDPSILDYSKLDEGTTGTGHRADVMGIVAYVNIDRQMRSLDIGSVILSPALQRTVASTEIHYLLLRHIFDEQGMAVNPSFHRAVWKCNALNQASRQAAERLGFVYEGTLRRSRMARGKWLTQPGSPLLTTSGLLSKMPWGLGSTLRTSSPMGSSGPLWCNAGEKRPAWPLPKDLDGQAMQIESAAVLSIYARLRSNQRGGCLATVRHACCGPVKFSIWTRYFSTRRTKFLYRVNYSSHVVRRRWSTPQDGSLTA